jgi:hypothetical protein
MYHAVGWNQLAVQRWAMPSLRTGDSMRFLSILLLLAVALSGCAGTRDISNAPPYQALIGREVTLVQDVHFYQYSGVHDEFLLLPSVPPWATHVGSPSRHIASHFAR